MDLHVEHERTDALQLYPGNARKGDTDAIAASLQAHGQYRPLVVQRSTGYVLAGNHTLQAARQLEWETVAITRVDVDDDQARRIVLVDNRTQDVAKYDNAALADLLQGLEGGLDGTGFDDTDLTKLLEKLEPPPRPDDEPGSDAGAPDVFAVGVACQSEDQRDELIARLEEWGYAPAKVDGQWAKGRGHN